MGIFIRKLKKIFLKYKIIFTLIFWLESIQSNDLNLSEMLFNAEEKRNEIKKLIIVKAEANSSEENDSKNKDTYQKYEIDLLNCINSPSFESYNENLLDESSKKKVFEMLDFIIENRKMFIIKNNTAIDKYKEAIAKIKEEIEVLVLYIENFSFSYLINCTRSHFKIINEIQQLIDLLKIIYSRSQNSLKEILDCEEKYKKLLENRHFGRFISSYETHNERIIGFKNKLENIRVNYDEIIKESSEAIIFYFEYNFEEIVITKYSEKNFSDLFIANEIFLHIESFIKINEDKNLANKQTFKEEVAYLYDLRGHIDTHISIYKIFRSNFFELLDKIDSCKKNILNMHKRIEKSANNTSETAEIYEINEFKDILLHFLNRKNQEFSIKMSKINLFETNLFSKVKKNIDYIDRIITIYNTLREKHKLKKIEEQINELKKFHLKYKDFVQKMQENLEYFYRDVVLNRNH